MLVYHGDWSFVVCNTKKVWWWPNIFFMCSWSRIQIIFLKPLEGEFWTTEKTPLLLDKVENGVSHPRFCTGSITSIFFFNCQIPFGLIFFCSLCAPKVNPFFARKFKFLGVHKFKKNHENYCWFLGPKTNHIFWRENSNIVGVK